MAGALAMSAKVDDAIDALVDALARERSAIVCRVAQSSQVPKSRRLLVAWSGWQFGGATGAKRPPLARAASD